MGVNDIVFFLFFSIPQFFINILIAKSTWARKKSSSCSRCCKYPPSNSRCFANKDRRMFSFSVWNILWSKSFYSSRCEIARHHKSEENWWWNVRNNSMFFCFFLGKINKKQNITLVYFEFRSDKELPKQESLMKLLSLVK